MVRVIADGSIDVAGLARRLEKDLAAHLDDPEVSIEIVEAIERHAASGKLKRFVPLKG
jgi:hypothetical protein